MECQNAQKSSPGVVKKRPSGFKDIVKKTEVKAETEEMQTQTFTAIKKSELKVETDADVFQVDILNAAAAEDDLSYEGKNEYMNEDEIESNCDGEGISITDSVDEFEDESDDTDQAPLKKRKLNSASQGKKSIKKTNCDESRDGDYKMTANESNTADELTESTRGFYNYSVIKSKIRKGEFRVVKKTGKSIVWRIFGKIEDKFGQELPNVVVCLNCSNILKHINSRTSNLLKHKCIVKAKSDFCNNSKFEVDTETKLNFLNTITEWIIQNCRSFQIVEDSGFIKTAEYLISLGANHGRNIDVQSMLPHPKAISGNVNRVYDDYIKKFKTEISSVKDNGFGILADLWENRNFKKAYISLTIHYVKEEVVVSRLLGMRCMEAEKCSSDNINAEVCAILKEFDLELDEKAIIATDRRSIMITAFQKHNHIFCVDRLLNNIIQKSMEEISDLTDLSKRCSDLAKYMNIYGTNSCFDTTLKNSSSTRWNTMYSLFVSVEENWPNIIQTIKKRNELIRIRNINPSHITAIIKVLKHFQEAFEKLEGENYATIHFVYMIIYHLQRKCVCDSSDLEVVKQLKGKLNNYLNSEILNNLTIYHKIAVFLFPPANKLYKFNQNEKKEIKNECRRIMESYQQEMPEPEHQNKAETEHEIKELFFDFVQPPQNDMLLDRIGKEIAAYENLNITSFSNDFNVLEWWNSHKNEYPLLYKLSCQILATPVSSAASRKLLYSTRNLILEKGCIEFDDDDDDNISELIFLHSNLKENELFELLRET